MIAITNYSLSPKDNRIKVKDISILKCPDCGLFTLKHYDYRIRGCKQEGGAKIEYYFPRFRCSNPQCNRIHIGIPNFAVPRKHYLSKVISGVLDGTINAYDENNVSNPSEWTMQRWIIYFKS